MDLNDGLMEDRIALIFGIPRLTEQKLIHENSIYFAYGLGKNTAYMKKVYKYYSSYNLEKSLLDSTL